MSANFAVVICAYDEGRWDRLHEAVRSVHQQTLPPQEVVVVVDHNDSLLARARRELKNVLVVENSETRGLRGARNSGMSAATASHVAFLDDDAQASERWLEFLAGPYEDPDVAGVGGSTVPVWEGGRPRWFPHEFEWVVGCTHRGIPLIRQEVRNLWGGNMSFRRKLVLAVGGFRIGYSCDDTELCIRLRQRLPRKRFILIPEAKVMHHVDRSRITVGRFLSRCYFEGGSKAVISRLVGAQDALASERRYTREVLPSAVRQEIIGFVSGRDRAGIARACVIIAGLASAAAGYGVGQLAPARAARKRGWNGDSAAERD
jgi:glucosyl-dolichyl phosphate glucuronosyltransferase